MFESNSFTFSADIKETALPLSSSVRTNPKKLSIVKLLSFFRNFRAFNNRKLRSRSLELELEFEIFFEEIKFGNVAFFCLTSNVLMLISL